MSVVAALAVLMAVASSPPSVKTTVPTLTVPFPPNAVPTPTVPKLSLSPCVPNKTQHPPLVDPSNKRRRSAAAATRRRERAVMLGFFKPKPNLAANSFLEVPRELVTQAKDMIRGKILKDTREHQVGRPSHSTRTASLEAYKENRITRQQFLLDAKTIRKQNLANHGSIIRNARWADIIEEETHHNAHLIADIIHQRLSANNISIFEIADINQQSMRNNNENNEQANVGTTTNEPIKGPNADLVPLPTAPNMRLHDSAPPSPPFSHRSNTNSFQSDEEDEGEKHEEEKGPSKEKPNEAEANKAKSPPKDKSPSKDIPTAPLLPSDFGKHNSYQSDEEDEGDK
jgi:hypothetical protein